MEVGQLINYGPYVWQVLDIKGNHALIITRDIISQRPYHDKHELVTWETSSLRKYLNQEFLQVFDEKELTQVKKVVNHNIGNHWYDPQTENDTEDLFFLLSLEEMAGPYFHDSLHLLYQKGKNQRYWFERVDLNNPSRRAKYLGYGWWYWVRTPGRLKTSAVYIHGDGNIGIQGNKASKKNYNTLHPITKSNEGGVRPACWIQIL